MFLQHKSDGGDAGMKLWVGLTQPNLAAAANIQHTFDWQKTMTLICLDLGRSCFCLVELKEQLDLLALHCLASLGSAKIP